jgi:hypothetical protein
MEDIAFYIVTAFVVVYLLYITYLIVPAILSMT